MIFILCLAQPSKEKVVVAVGQRVGQLEEPIASLVDHPLVQTGHPTPGLMPVVAPFVLARQRTLGGTQGVQGLREVERADNFAPVTADQERLETEVEPNGAVTLPVGNVDVFLDNEGEGEIAERVALNRYRFNGVGKLTRFAELVNVSLDADAVAAQQRPARLLERERTVLPDLLELGRRGLDARLAIAKEERVGAVNALANVLPGLTAHQGVVRVLGELAPFGDVLHHVVLAHVLARQAVVAPMERDAVVPDEARHVDALMQQSILFIAVQRVLVGAGDHHRFF